MKYICNKRETKWCPYGNTEKDGSIVECKWHDGVDYKTDFSSSPSSCTGEDYKVRNVALVPLPDEYIHISDLIKRLTTIKKNNGDLLIAIKTDDFVRPIKKDELRFDDDNVYL